MKVNGENQPIQLPAYQNQVRADKNPPGANRMHASASAPDDKVHLSARAREVQEAAQALAQLPDVREDKVQQVKMEVETGTYKVIGRKVAMDMLKETFENNMLLNQIDLHA